MSGKKMIEMLMRVGYPDAAKLDPHSLDWAFEDPSTASFMQWVCSIGKENVLRQQDMEEYENLMKAGKVLSGSHLKDALAASVSASSSSHSYLDRGDVGDDDDDNEEDEFQLQADVDKLEETVAKLQEGRKTLLKERQQLDNKLVELKNKQSRVDNLASKAKRGYDDALAASNNYSSKIDEALQKLTESVNNITKLYTSTTTTGPQRGARFCAGKTDNADAVFLSQVDLSRFNQAEEHFSQDLTVYTKKRFFEGMAEIAGTTETDQYSMLNVSHPENVLLEDDCDKESFLEDCQEFALLQAIFPKSEINRLNALVNTKKAMYAVHEAKSILHLLKTEKFPTLSSAFSHLQMRAEDHVQQSQTEAGPYQAAVPELVKELGTLQGTEILTGNYELKLQRQDYFTKNQDRVIKYLEEQRSRSELLLMFYNLELRFHERTHHLLCAAEKMFQSHLHDWNQRMKCLDDSDLSRAKFERNVVDARDTSCNTVHKMMGKCPLTNLSGNKDEDRHLYLPLTKVKDTATNLYSTYEHCLTSQLVEDQALKQNMSLLEDCVKEGRASLYAESSTLTELPNLSPADVQASMVSLQGSISSLTSNLDTVVKDIKHKKKVLKGNPALVKERDMFTIFHTKPERLISTITGLEESLKISMASESSSSVSVTASVSGGVGV